jgi:nitrite reductase (NADH) small subunit
MRDLVWKKIGPLSNIPVRGARRLCFGLGGKPIAVFRTGEDKFFALVDECPHKKGPLSEGIVSGNTITCPLHNWVIGLDTGIAAEPDEGHPDRSGQTGNWRALHWSGTRASSLLSMASKFAIPSISGSRRTSKPNDIRIVKLLVSFDSKIRWELDMRIMRILESGHQP